MRSFAFGGVDLGKGLKPDFLQLGVDLVLSSSRKTTLYHTDLPNRVGEDRQQRFLLLQGSRRLEYLNYYLLKG